MNRSKVHYVEVKNKYSNDGFTIFKTTTIITVGTCLQSKDKNTMKVNQMAKRHWKGTQMLKNVLGLCELVYAKPKRHCSFELGISRESITHILKGDLA